MKSSLLTSERGERDQGDGRSDAPDPRGQRTQRVRARLHGPLPVRLRGAGAGPGGHDGGTRARRLRRGRADRAAVRRAGDRAARPAAGPARRPGHRRARRARPGAGGQCLVGAAGGRGARCRTGRDAAGAGHDDRGLLQRRHPVAGVRHAVLPAEPGPRHRRPHRRSPGRHHARLVVHPAVRDRGGDVPAAGRGDGHGADAALAAAGGRARHVEGQLEAAGRQPGDGAAVRPGLRDLLRLLRAVRVGSQRVRRGGRRDIHLHAGHGPGREHPDDRGRPVRRAEVRGARPAHPGDRPGGPGLGGGLAGRRVRGAGTRQPGDGHGRLRVDVRAVRSGRGDAVADGRPAGRRPGAGGHGRPVQLGVRPGEAAGAGHRSGGGRSSRGVAARAVHRDVRAVLAGHHVSGAAARAAAHPGAEPAVAGACQPGGQPGRGARGGGLRGGVSRALPGHDGRRLRAAAVLVCRAPLSGSR
ncbi:hypothetical protein SGPA1_50002 [Streptomyces misionensis JCM 4497]